MKRHEELTDEEYEAMADRLDERLDKLDPDVIVWQDGSDLSEVARATDALCAAEARQLKAVIAARENGRSWTRIAIGLDVSRQAARQRFADKVSS